MSLVQTAPLTFGLALFGLAYLNDLAQRLLRA